ncbi:MAG: DHHA1 domain-containing protein, partial [Ekhidna sp.]|nr:DHHA1 domain-containing protein [Ekhidna sp.]
HFAKMNPPEIKEVERIVNEKICSNIELQEQRNVPIDQAKAMGAMALFGEKYGDFVRVIIFDPNYSVELCGGTHVPRTGNIGVFKIVSEGSSAAGVRRIEAVTSQEAINFYEDRLSVITDLEGTLKTPKVKETVKKLMDENTSIQKKISKLNNRIIAQMKEELKNSGVDSNGKKLIAYKGDFPTADVLKQLAFELKREVKNLILLIAANIDDKPMLTVMLSDNLVSKEGMNANEMIKIMAKEIRGGGGGQPFYATAGGKDISGLEKALNVGKEMIH